ncbi:MAG: hypothetical protein WDZ27_05955 [Waddliaceae bacterium]
MLWFIFLLLVGCQTEQPENVQTYLIKGREGQTPLYRIEVPNRWSVVIPDGDLNDSKKPLATIDLEEIHITFHNFPGFAIPPAAQVARWKTQIHEIDPFTESQTPCHFSGFFGLSYFCENQDLATLAFAMQIDPLHLQKLKGSEKGAVFTLKAVGPPELLYRYKQEITAMAESIEIIDEIAP